MFTMTTPLEKVNELLLQAKFQMDRLRSGKTFQALQLLDSEVQEYSDEIYELVNKARFISLTYVETMRNDRREKRHRYKKNKKKKTNVDFI